MTERLRNAGVAAALIVALSGSACSEPTPGVARGEALFDTCVPCHGGEGEGNQALGAPAIAGLPQWYVQAQLEKFEAGWRGAHPMDTVGIRMKSMARSLDLEGDLESVAEYVAGMAPTNPAPVLHGDAQAGQAVYQSTCIACHGPDALGNETLNAPPLVGQSDWYLLAQFQKFRKGWRGTNPNDTWGSTMYPNSLQYDDTQVENALAYIQTLQ